jgi:hypothetical protein
MSRLETMPAETVWNVANLIPPEWYGGDVGEMEALVEKLLARRSRIRELVETFGNSDRRPFPKWGEKSGVGVEETWRARKWGSSIEGSVN